MNFKLKWGMGIFVVTYVLIFLAMRLTNWLSNITFRGAVNFCFIDDNHKTGEAWFDVDYLGDKYGTLLYCRI